MQVFSDPYSPAQRPNLRFCLCLEHTGQRKIYMAVRIADRNKEIRSIFYTKAFRICSSECNFSAVKNEFVAFTK